MASTYDQFILFGDSLTQQSFSQERGFAFGAQLTDDYTRRLDVVNRGFNGFNTEQALHILSRIIPTPEQAKVRFLTIFFGANDCVAPSSSTAQHVSLEDFSKNMKKIITHPAVKAQSPRIILITPPAMDEYVMKVRDEASGGSLRRTVDRTKTYVDCVKALGAEFDLAVLDLWTAMITRLGWKDGDEYYPGSLKAPKVPKFDTFVYDGLHLAPDGYRVLYDELRQLIPSRWPDQEPLALGFVIPAWDNKPAWKEALGH